MSHEDPTRQLTLRAVLLSIVLTVILAAANAYLGQIGRASCRERV